jgi:hypothetical protein
MRRQEKYIIYTGLACFGLTALVDFILQLQEHEKRNEKMSWNSYNALRTLKSASVVGIAGGLVGNEFYKSEFANESKKPFSSDRFLKEILKKENIRLNPEKLFKMNGYKNEIKQKLAQEFQDELAYFPEETGSFSKRTAINSTYDIDIVLPLKKENSFGNMKNLSDGVHDKIDELFGENASVKKSKRGTTIVFQDNTSKHSFDIVYGKEIRCYAKDKKLNLYTRPDFFWQQGTCFKTNIGIQKGITFNQPKAREVIKVLKKYFDKNNLRIETTLMDQLVVEALSEKNYGSSCSTFENFLNSLEYISTKLSNKSIKDYANSNNNLLNKLTYTEKVTLLNFINSDLKKIQANEYYIRDIFNV